MQSGRASCVCALSISIALITSTACADVTQLIPLGDAANYSIIYGGNGGNLLIGRATINGNVAIGDTGAVQFSGPGIIRGSLDFSAENVGQYLNNNVNNVGPSSVNYGQANVTTDLTSLAALSSSLAGLGSNIVLNGTQTVNESAGQLNTIHGVTYRAFNVTSYSSSIGALLTINGDGSGNPVVFNFGYNSNVNLIGDVALNGLVPDQVLYNFTTSGQSIQLGPNQTIGFGEDPFQGVILAPNDAISIVNANIVDGRVFGGDGGGLRILTFGPFSDTITPPPPPDILNLFVEKNGTLVGNTFDPSLPSIVISHGWQPGCGSSCVQTYIDRSGQQYNDPTLTLVPSPGYGASNVGYVVTALEGKPGLSANIFTFNWEGAYTPTQLSDVGQSLVNDLFSARAAAGPAGTALYNDLKGVFQSSPSEYDQPIQFIGHSFGSLVVSEAARLLGFGSNHFDIANVTVLDAPFDALDLGPGIPMTTNDLLWELPTGAIAHVENFYGSQNLDLSDPSFGGHFLHQTEGPSLPEVTMGWRIHTQT